MAVTKFHNTDSGLIVGSGASLELTIASTIANYTTSTPCKGCFVSCKAANTGPVSMNISAAASASAGVEIPKGNPVFVPIDDVNKLYFYSATNGDKIDILYLKG